MKIKSGNIPKNLTFFVRSPETVYFRWYDVDYDDADKTEKIMVNPCYISDTDNKKTLKTGKAWADQKIYNYETKSYVESASTTFTIENKPFNKLQIITLEIRDQGGRAYKVNAEIAEKIVYFDLREDVLLDIMFNSGIKPGAIIEGKFVFAKIGSQMKVIRVGSKLHEIMVQSTEFKTKAKLDLEIGGVYSNKLNDKYIFLGEFYTRDIKLEGYDRGRYNYETSNYSYNFTSAKLKNPEKVFVFHIYHDFSEKDGSLWHYQKIERYNGRDREKGEASAYDLHIIKSHNFKILEKKIAVPENYYLDVIKKISKTDNINHLITNYSQLFNLSKEKGYVHPFFKSYE